mmetsp:Transcript_83797/g.166269  ORF Transcript_83797/g.166269 Transcript_83797/m.166269 type:complete len:235 (-) Transcript_83797:301-1005(-)
MELVALALSLGTKALQTMQNQRHARAKTQGKLNTSRKSSSSLLTSLCLTPPKCLLRGFRRIPCLLSTQPCALLTRWQAHGKGVVASQGRAPLLLPRAFKGSVRSILMLHTDQAVAVKHSALIANTGLCGQRHAPTKLWTALRLTRTTRSLVARIGTCTRQWSRKVMMQGSSPSPSQMMTTKQGIRTLATSGHGSQVALASRHLVRAPALRRSMPVLTALLKTKHTKSSSRVRSN